MVAPADVSPATLFCSHAWEGSFADEVEALEYSRKSQIKTGKSRLGPTKKTGGKSREHSRPIYPNMSCTIPSGVAGFRVGNTLNSLDSWTAVCSSHRFGVHFPENALRSCTAAFASTPHGLSRHQFYLNPFAEEAVPIVLDAYQNNATLGCHTFSAFVHCIGQFGLAWLGTCRLLCFELHGLELIWLVLAWCNPAWCTSAVTYFASNQAFVSPRVEYLIEASRVNFGIQNAEGGGVLDHHAGVDTNEQGILLPHLLGEGGDIPCMARKLLASVTQPDLVVVERPLTRVEIVCPSGGHTGARDMRERMALGQCAFCAGGLGGLSLGAHCWLVH
eukprot:gene2649-biopygen2022